MINMRNYNCVKRYLLMGILILIALPACTQGSEPESTPILQDDFRPGVSVTGKLVPVVWTTAGATVGGQVIEIQIKEGDTVSAGDVLLQLDDRDAAAAVRQAEAALLQAKAELDLLNAGPRAEDLEVNAAQVEAARAALTQTIEQRDQLWTGSLETSQVSADAAIAAAQSEELTARQIHDDMMKCYDVEMPDGSTKEICPTLGTYEERARSAWHATVQQLRAAEAGKAILEPEHWAQLAIANAAIDAAQEQVELTEAQHIRAATGSRPAEVAVVEAGIAQAETALAAAELRLDYAAVRAPIDGIIGAVDIRVGQFAAPGVPLVTLGDLTTLQIETTDLDEIDVGRVMPGQQAVVTFDALPDQTFAAEVVRISPMASSTGAGVNYTVVLALGDFDPILRWGMTAFVDIVTE
jgi:multidrug resistance efflux pump